MHLPTVTAISLVYRKTVKAKINIPSHQSLEMAFPNKINECAVIQLSECSFVNDTTVCLVLKKKWG